VSEKFDVVVIGAGMSGLAAAIRLAMFDKKVIVLEKHVITGGLNSYYSRRVRETKEMLDFDVGLHALTNFATRGEKRKPLTKLLKQLRIPYDSLQLKQQTHSLIKFKSADLKFSNDFNLLRSEVESVFPSDIDNFNRFVTYVSEYNEVDLDAKYIPARDILASYFKEELLQEMLIAPLLIYGSAWENDMDFSQFVIMFKSIYMEGFSRPVGGVRTILELLEDRLEAVGGEVRFRSSVESIEVSGSVKGIYLKNGDFLETDTILSSAGFPETMSMVGESNLIKPEIGKLSFMESIIVTKDKAFLDHFDATIVFFNESDKYNYQKSPTEFDSSSAVFCLPDNYERENKDGHGHIRVTYMANFNKWNDLSKDDYKKIKNNVYDEALSLSQNLLDTKVDVLYKDVFSPTTIKKYTSHFDGTVYGSTTKVRNGKSGIDGLYIIGTDQGFLGIVGSMLSGISMANLYGLMEHK
jgi:phytoene dehydrogenase-like protein